MWHGEAGGHEGAAVEGVLAATYSYEEGMVGCRGRGEVRGRCARGYWGGLILG